jgi:hypothetical protein
MNVTFVTTTIHPPRLLLDYARNARDYGHAEVAFVVIGDRKTPAEAADVCRAVAADYPCVFLDIAAQEAYLRRFPDLWSHLRFDSIQRRNIGLVWAYEHGAGTVITIDDDNFVEPGDFIARHAVVGSSPSLPAYTSPSGWYNVCAALAADEDVRFYHRGFPWPQRWNEGEARLDLAAPPRRIAVNAGFWLDDPDLDALARMHRQPVVRGFQPRAPHSFRLEPGTWSPFNSQNTALMRAAIPAYFLSPYAGRYDDIWASYIVTRIAEHLGDAIAFGEPLVSQHRNPHDLWRDLDVERDGMILTPGLCAALRGLRLAGSSYHGCLGEIAAGLGAAWPAANTWTPSQRECRLRLIEGLAIWHAVFDRLGAAGDARAAAASAR